ncbi:unnamed protein product [Brachionus calyciflorus]|uniref:Uncharacterized protein n=1 Tax=Brachionus calyciflorus TaxID=104777 RepID=A0A813M3M1_9BILA|nr:unnamed protein product [Brachionus calyciflorus]
MGLLILILTNKILSSPNSCSFFPSYCNCIGPKDITCQNFDDFLQLNFSSGNSSRLFKYVNFHPKEPLSLSNKLNLNGLSFTDDAILSLKNLNSLDFFTNLSLHSSSLNLELTNSSLMVYYDVKNLLEYKCNFDLIDSSFKPVFSSFKTILLDVLYPGKICPLIFQNSNIEKLRIKNLNNYNKIQFKNLPDFILTRLNSTIRRLEIDYSLIQTLDNGFLNKYLFNNLEELIITETELYSIDENVFKFLPRLNFLLLLLENFGEFFKSSSNLWFKGLNIKNQSELIIALIDPRSAYEFHDEDFCYFYLFPHKNQVYTFIKTKEKLECSCTLVWLMKNVNSSRQNGFLISSSSVYDCVKSKDFEIKLVECNFEQRVEDCSRKVKMTIVN